MHVISCVCVNFTKQKKLSLNLGKVTHIHLALNKLSLVMRVQYPPTFAYQLNCLLSRFVHVLTASILTETVNYAIFILNNHLLRVVQ